MTGWILLADLYAIGCVGYCVRDMIEGEGAWHPRWAALAWPVAVMHEAIAQRLLVRAMLKAWWFGRAASHVSGWQPAPGVGSPIVATTCYNPTNCQCGTECQDIGGGRCRYERATVKRNDVWGDNLHAALTGTGPKA